MEGNELMEMDFVLQLTYFFNELPPTLTVHMPANTAQNVHHKWFDIGKRIEDKCIS